MPRAQTKNNTGLFSPFKTVDTKTGEEIGYFWSTNMDNNDLKTIITNLDNKTNNHANLVGRTSSVSVGFIKLAIPSFQKKHTNMFWPGQTRITSDVLQPWQRKGSLQPRWIAEVAIRDATINRGQSRQRWNSWEDWEFHRTPTGRLYIYRSMDGCFFNGFHVGKYTTPMDPMGMEYPVVISFHLKNGGFQESLSFSSIFSGEHF